MTTQTPFPKLLDACIHCGLCLPACPTYRVTGSEAESPRGRIYLMREWQEDRLPAIELQESLDHCLGCLSCQTACPSGVQYEALLMHMREALAPKTQHPLGRRVKRAILRWMLPNQTLLSLMRWGLRWTQKRQLDHWLLGQPWMAGFSGKLHRLGGPHLTQWLKLAPRMTSESAPESVSRGHDWHTLIPTLVPGAVFDPPEGVLAKGQTVALFLGCIMNTMFADIHAATVHVLLAQGFRVTIPHGQTCCGALAYHAGETDIARPLAQQNLKAFLQAPPVQAPPDWIVLNSAGCGASLKSLPHWLKTPDAQDFSNRVIDVMALLAQAPLMPMSVDQSAQTVTYHAACHLHHAQGVQIEPMNVLRQMPNLTLIPLKDASLCCGSAGVYNLEHPDLANDILAEKIRHLNATGADCVVSGNPGCLLQLQMGLRDSGSRMIARHPIEILADAYSS